MSGYSAGALNLERIRDGELAFIQKPFTAEALLEKVRTTLSTPPATGDQTPTAVDVPRSPGPQAGRQRRRPAPWVVSSS
jgi:FixJ family two-component response regulator